jgi:hypothetical protein
MLRCCTTGCIDQGSANLCLAHNVSIQLLLHVAGNTDLQAVYTPAKAALHFNTCGQVAFAFMFCEGFQLRVSQVVDVG